MKFLIPMFISIFFSTVVLASQPGQSLQPTDKQGEIGSRVAAMIKDDHYKKVEFDDALSAAIFDEFISNLDPSRNIFLQEDINSLESSYKNMMEDSILNKDLVAPFKIFNTYLTRTQERIEFAKERIMKPFDFTIDENFQKNRSQSAWATNVSSLNEIWRKQIKSKMLQEILSGKSELEARELIINYYARVEKHNTHLRSEDVFNSFMNAFANAIEPHTNYLSPRAADNFRAEMSLSRAGIGAVLEPKGEYTVITGIPAGGAVALDGRLKPGDRIVGVGQGSQSKITKVVGWRIEDTIDLIRGEKGTIARLEILGKGKSFEEATTIIEITRDLIKLEDQAAKKSIIDIASPEGLKKVGVITLPRFYRDYRARVSGDQNYRSCAHDIEALVKELQQEEISALVVDLRNNGGGDIMEVADLASLFLDRGPITLLKYASGKREVFMDTYPGVLWEGPLTVMVNRNSASASEIFAAVIQDYGRGVIVGETTYGKGTVQSLLEVSEYKERAVLKPSTIYLPSASSQEPAVKEDMGQLKLTTAQFYRINGISTQIKGVTPDILFPYATAPETYGESELSNALAWNRTWSTGFTPENDVYGLLEELAQLSQERTTANTEFMNAVEKMQNLEKDNSLKSVSLQESTRRESLALLKRSTKQESEIVADEVEQKSDIFIHEAANIALDILKLQTE